MDTTALPGDDDGPAPGDDPGAWYGPAGGAPRVGRRVPVALAVVVALAGAFALGSRLGPGRIDAVVWPLGGTRWAAVAVAPGWDGHGEPEVGGERFAPHDGEGGDEYARGSRATAARVAGAVAGHGVDVAPLGTVHGPSGGLALTLAALDGRRWDGRDGELLAATGTIEPGGFVGMVGMVDAKVSAARRAGARLVFVPRGVGGMAVGLQARRDEAVAAGRTWRAAGGTFVAVPVSHVADALWFTCGALGDESSCAAGDRAARLAPGWTGH